MRIGLFIPCYIDAFFPEVGIATLELLERLGHEVVYPRDQTCCGQPMANSGFNAEAADTEALFVPNFSDFDYVVAPSGSCVHHVRDNFDAIEQTPRVKEVRARTYEIVEFLQDILKVDAFPWARFPHRVGLHNSCGTLRRLKHAPPSNFLEPFYSKPMDLLSESAALSPPPPRRDQSACLGGDDHAPSPPRHSKEDEGRDGKRQMCAAGGIVGVGLQRCSSRTDLLCKGSTGARGSWTIGGASQCFLAHLSRRDS